MRYSLANYKLSIVQNDTELAAMFPALAIGGSTGSGSYLDSISLSVNNNQWSTVGYATGGWVHEKSLDRTGTATITLNQLAPAISQFKRMSNVHYNGEYEGFTMTLVDSFDNEVARCIDCYFTKIPDQSVQERSQNQTWSVTCGQIIFS